MVGWGATVREIDALATLFDSVVHIAPLHRGPAPGSSLPYRAPNVRLHAVPPTGGLRWWDKSKILLRYPDYVRAILLERGKADVVHIRTPANIGMVSLLFFGLVRRPRARWAKYAGDWQRERPEPWSYRIQKWWLKNNLHRGMVTINGRSPEAAPHIHSFLNPCLTEGELEQGAAASRDKDLRQPVRLVFVGRLEAVKGVGVCLEVLAQLQRARVGASLDLIGEGREQPRFEQQARNLGISSGVNFHGGLARGLLGQFYAQAHFILLPSSASEGWPKVLSEAMAYGAVPIASPVGSISEHLGRFEVGRVIQAREACAFTQTIEDYLANSALWQEESIKAVRAARQFSYTNYLVAVRDLLKLPAPSQN